MLEVKVTIATTPELTGVLNSLVTAINGKAQPSVQVSAPDTQVPMSVAPVQAIPEQLQPAAVPQIPVQQPVTPVASVPVASAPQFTHDQIMTAGAALMDAGKVNDLLSLLQSFGVQSVMELKSEQLGSFATEMRKLGAAI